jgi:MGT family glycosyltransferase
VTAPVAFFAMDGIGHLRRLRPLIAGVVERGAPAYVFTATPYRELVVDAGGVHVDVLDGRELETESRPRPVRNVTFAGEHGAAVARDVRERGAGLVVSDSFAVVGRVVARLLDLPYVNVCSGHGADPADREPFVSLHGTTPGPRASGRCLRAVETLRDRYGIADASPFSYVADVSPYLNLYGEPPAFLDASLRSRLEPVAFLGSLSPDEDGAGGAAQPLFGEPRAATRAYVSLGTIAWRYFAGEMLETLRVIVDALAARDVQVLVSLGDADVDAGGLERPGVEVRRWVDQWQALSEADLFVTHHGLNSTHEAIWHGVPMVGYPLIGDQPGQAATCERLGLSVPLARTRRASLTVAAVHAALDTVEGRRAAMAAALARARQEEERVIAARGAVVDRVLALRG